jgi:rSAM/selenodomain-associated transferase 1
MRRLALFARRPRVGEVKTRLSPAVPAPIACDLHRAMVEDAIAALAGAGADERILYWAGAAAGRDAPALPAEIHEREQRGAHLGERLEHAFDELIAAPGDRAVIFGADCPALDPAALDAAFDALDAHDVALGPAHDGGYYLVGLRRRAPELFRDIEWSTSRVLEQTLARASRAGLIAAVLPALDDLDTPEDLLRWIALRAGGGGPTAPRALDRALRVIGLLPPG